MQKMEAAGEILSRLKQQPNGTHESSSQTSDWTNRRALIQRQLVSFYTSCRREQPEPKMFKSEVDLACRDWEEIPTERIEEVCAEARKQAGAFMVSNGLVAAVWRTREAERRRPKSKPFTALPAPDMTEADRAEIAEMFRKMREDLGGTRPKDWTP